MNSEIRARKKKFAALVTVMMLVMCNVMPAFAATHTADEWMRYGSFNWTEDYYVNPGDEIQISGSHTLYEYAYYQIIYYDDNNNEIKDVKSSTADEQYDDGGYYFTHNVFDYSDIMGESDKSRLFKNWKVTDVFKSGGYGGHVYLTAQFYDELNVVYHLPEGAVNSPDNLSTYPQGKSDIILGKASMEGYTFDGWYLDAEFTQQVASIDTTQTGTVDLYGEFTPADYDISYELDGGTNDAGNPATYTYGIGVTEFKPAVKEGYAFDGWYLDAEFTQQVASIDTTQTGEVALHAKFKPEVYDISYELDGGTNDAGNPATYTYGIGVTEFKPAVKEGYAFDGWYLDTEFTQPIASIDATQTGGVALHAKFTLNPPVDPGDGEEPGDEEEPGNEEDPGNDEKPENPGNTETPSDNDPKLGEDNITVLLTGLTGLAGLGIFTMTLKKRRKSEQN